mgnify:CR=1 FL=1
MSRKSLTILGSTSTIGVNTLDVVQQHHERFNLVALTAHQSTDKLLEQCMQFKPKYAAMSDANAANKLQKAIKEQSNLDKEEASARKADDEAQAQVDKASEEANKKAEEL